MRKKALILGAPPSTWEGPWVRVTPDAEWEVEPSEDYRDCVGVRVKLDSGATREILLNRKRVSVKGATAVKGFIREGAQDLGIRQVSVNVKQVA